MASNAVKAKSGTIGVFRTADNIKGGYRKKKVIKHDLKINRTINLGLKDIKILKSE